jgi:phage RecT family recombinase
MANEVTQGASRQPTEIAVFSGQLEKGASEIRRALPSGLSPEKFQRTVITAAQKNPELLKADRQSLLLACIMAAQDGLLPDGREAALVIFSTRVKLPTGKWESRKLVQYMPMTYGLRKKILQARDAKGEPLVVALSVGVVYKVEAENGNFRYEVGTEPPLNHTPLLSITGEEAADENIVAAYSIATMADGTKSYELMRRFEIDKVRQQSQTGAVGRIAKYDMGDIKKGEEVPPKGPWVDWFAEMAKKTVVRRHSKTLPMSGDVIIDLGTDEADFEAGHSAANVLSSETPDAAREITDQTTGEVLDREAIEQWLGEAEAGIAAAKSEKALNNFLTLLEQRMSDIVETFPDLHERVAALIPSDEERAKRFPKRGQAKEKAGNAESGSNGGNASADNGGGSAASAEATERDELGVTKDPHDVLATELCKAFDKAEFLVDLDRKYDENEVALDEMPEEMRAHVVHIYNVNRQRLGARQPEPAQ